MDNRFFCGVIMLVTLGVVAPMQASKSKTLKKELVLGGTEFHPDEQKDEQKKQQQVEQETSAADAQEPSGDQRYQVDFHPKGGAIIGAELGAYDFAGASVYCGAAEPGYKKAALAIVNASDQITVMTIAHEKVKRGKVEKQSNPLYDQQILHLAYSSHGLFVVTAQRPDTLYLYRGYTNENTAVIYEVAVRDQFGQSSVIDRLWVNGGNVCALVHSKKESEQQGGPALAFARIGMEEKKKKKTESQNKDEQESEEEEEKVFYFKTFDPITGKLGPANALALDADFAARAGISIKEGLSSFDVLAMQWLGKLYIGLHVRTKGSNDSSDGAHALLVGSFQDNKLTISPAISDVVCPGARHIVGVQGSNEVAYIHNVRTMTTSTGLSYLIVHGGVGPGDKVSYMLSALPRAIPEGNSSDVGKIARADCIPQTITPRRKRVAGRRFTEIATSHTHAPRVDDSAVRVGGSGTLPGPVADFITYGDTVFASVEQAKKGQPGLFYSQALIDGDGKIAAWTPWQRAAGVNEPVKKLSHFGHDGFMLLGPCGKDGTQLRLFSTGWYGIVDSLNQSNLSLGLQTFLHNEFVKKRGGIQGLFDLPATTPGLSNSADSVALMMVTGYDSVALVQTTTKDAKGNSEWYTGAFTEKNVALCAEGTTKHISDTEQPPQAIIYKGGALENLGPITKAHIAVRGSNAWLVVGGCNGVAVLTDDAGNGWHAQRGLGNNFSNLPKHLTFKKRGNYSFVRSITSDGQYLYILTPDTLDRIELAPGSFIHDEKNVCTLAQRDQLMQRSGITLFTDMCISHGRALLATSKGLYATEPGIDVRDVPEQHVVNWHKVMVPSVCEYITQLIPIAANGNPADVGYGGQLYVVASSLYDYNGSISRLYLNYHDDEQPIRVVPDSIIEGEPAAWIYYPSHISKFITDGAHHVILRSRDSHTPAHIAVIGPATSVMSGIGNVLPYINNSTETFTSIVRSSISGSLWITANDCTRVHE